MSQEFKPVRCLGDVDDIRFSVADASRLFMFLRKMGLLNNHLKMCRNNIGEITFSKEFKYPMGEDGNAVGTKTIRLGEFFELLIRLDRKRHNAFEGEKKYRSKLIRTMQKSIAAMEGGDEIQNRRAK